MYRKTSDIFAIISIASAMLIDEEAEWKIML